VLLPGKDMRPRRNPEGEEAYAELWPRGVVCLLVRNLSELHFDSSSRTPELLSPEVLRLRGYVRATRNAPREARTPDLEVNGLTL
jgi:hypothetical protein